MSSELPGKFIKERIKGQCSLNLSLRAEDTVPKIGEGLGIYQGQANANRQGNSTDDQGNIERYIAPSKGVMRRESEVGEWVRGENAIVESEEGDRRYQEPRELGLIEAPRSSNVYRDGEDDNFYEDVRVLVASLENVSEEQKNSVEELVRKFKRLFSCKVEGSGDYVHGIRLKDTRTVVRRSYPVPWALREAVGREINDMLANGIIERSTSQYCNPLRVVKKRDGRVRICLDARFLNNIIESDNEATPLISKLL